MTYDPITGAETARYRYVTDVRGSVRLVVDADTGAVAQRLDYDARGEVVCEWRAPGFDQPFGYAGGLWDRETGLVRFGARDYDPEIGRWTAKDPIGFDAGDGNLYGYVGGDPVNGVDPSGLMSCNPYDNPGLPSPEELACIYVMSQYTSSRDTSVCDGLSLTGSGDWADNFDGMRDQSDGTIDAASTELCRFCNESRPERDLTGCPAEEPTKPTNIPWTGDQHGQNTNTAGVRCTEVVENIRMCNAVLTSGQCE